MMINSKTFCSLVLAALFLNRICLAQPFDIDTQRWIAGTAQTQAQGFSQGDPLRLTWGIAQEGMSVGAFGVGEAISPNIIRSFFDGIHGAGTEATIWRPIIESTFDRWESISGLDYSYEANDDGAAWVTSTGVLGARADVRISAHSIDGQSGSNTLAYNFFPDFADQVIDSDNVTFFSDSTNGYRGTRNVLAHETGHGIGMSHLESSDSAQLMEPFINNSFDGPQYFDILSAQRGYGDFNEKSFAQLGNDDSSRATVLGGGSGVIADGATIAIGQDAKNFVVASTAIDFLSIDAASDTDYFSFSVNSSGTIDIELEALGFTFNVGPQGGPESPFDSTMRSDLILSLFDNSLTSLGMANLTGLGGTELLTGISISAGNYFISVQGVDNIDSNVFDVQFYGLSATFTAAAIPEPGSLAILATGFVGVGLLNRRKRAA